MGKTMIQNIGLVMVLSTLCMFSSTAQSHLSGNALNILLAKAQELESHDRYNMALQVWQQMLFSDPHNLLALAGAARSEMKLGNTVYAHKYLAQLEKIDPKNPEIAKIEILPPAGVRMQLLAQASKLAKTHQYEEAMSMYRQVFGNNPPAGDWALSYYETEAGTTSGHDAAIAGLRNLTKRFPSDPRYSVSLGRILTYDPKTRAAGIAILMNYPDVAAAKNALGQALLWDSPDPRTAPLIREYLKHNSDPTLEHALQHIKQEQQQERTAPQTPTQDPEIKAAYSALNNGHVADAERHFEAMRKVRGKIGTAYVGLGFVAMKQKNFALAVQNFVTAEAHGIRDPNVSRALQVSRFWSVMGQAGDALNTGQTQQALDCYSQALKLKPEDPDALEGLGGAYLAAGQGQKAEHEFRQELQRRKDSSGAWRGLVTAQFLQGYPLQALATVNQMPQSVATKLAQDLAYLSTLASVYTAVGQQSNAEKVLQEAMQVPLPNQDMGPQPYVLISYANLLTQAKRYQAAVDIYQKVLAVEPNNLGAWQGLVRAFHVKGDDADASAAIVKMPHEVYLASQRDSGFLVMMASIDQALGYTDTASKFLEQAAALSPHPSVALSLQLAGTLLQRGDPVQAYTIYRHVLDSDPDQPNAWLGLLSALHQSSQDKDASVALQQIPARVRAELDMDPAYLQVLASIQAANGNSEQALAALERASHIYSSMQGVPMPTGAAIQYAWLLLNANEEQPLYPLLLGLTQRSHLTSADRRQLELLWSTWSVQRAAELSKAGQNSQALDVLNAAYRVFNSDPQVLRTLAGGYLQAGYPKQAEMIYETLDIDHPTLADYQAVIAAAIAAQDTKKAQQWLQSSLKRYPSDPNLLQMAGQFEANRGDIRRAEIFYRAALNSLGPGGGIEEAMPSGPAVPKTSGASNPVSDRKYAVEQMMKILAPPSHRQHPKQPSNLIEVPRSSSFIAPDISSPAGTQPSQEQTSPNPVQQGPQKQKQPDIPTQPIGEPTLPGKAVGVPPPIQENGITTTTPSGDSTRHDRLLNAADMGDAQDTLQQGREQMTSVQDAIPNLLNTSPFTSLSPRTTLPGTPLRGHSYSFNAVQPKGMAAVSAQSTSPVSVMPPVPQTLSVIPNFISQNKENTQTTSILSHGVWSQSNFPSHALDDGYEISLLQARQQQHNDLYENQSDQQDEGLPPLVGPLTQYSRPKTQREQIEQQLATLEGESSPWIGGSSWLNYRNGNPGIDQLLIFTSQGELSGMLGPSVRGTAVVNPVLLYTGIANGNSGFRLGTLPLGAIPPQQLASGVGGEAQLRTHNFGVAVGYTPYGFPVGNVIGSLFLNPNGGPFTFTYARQSILDSQLSYSGLHDPGSATSTFAGNLWGGVVANAFELHFTHGNDQSGWYVQGGGQYITGKHVLTNGRGDGDGGAYWRILNRPNIGKMTVGMNFFGMHYQHDELIFTYGQGGYFSPSAYFLANVPVNLAGHEGTKFHYNLTGSLGWQAFQQDPAPYFPIDPTIQASNNSPYFAGGNDISANYSFLNEGAYVIDEHWYAGAFANFNNTRNYNNAIVGFYFRYAFHAQPSVEEGPPTGLFSPFGLRPFSVP